MSTRNVIELVFHLQCLLPERYARRETIVTLTRFEFRSVLAVNFRKFLKIRNVKEKS